MFRIAVAETDGLGDGRYAVRYCTHLCIVEWKSGLVQGATTKEYKRYQLGEPKVRRLA